MDSRKDYSELLKNPDEVATHLNSDLKDGNLEWFLHAIHEIDRANQSLEIDEYVNRVNEKYTDSEEVGQEILTLFNLLHGLGLRLVPQNKTEKEPIKVPVPETCRIDHDAFRKNRFGDIHTEKEIDCIVSNLDRLQYPDDEFLEYASKFYYFRNEFYKRGTVKNDILTSNYADMVNKENATRLHRYDIDPVIYRLVINYNQSLDDSLKNIKHFCKETEQVVREQYLKDEEQFKAAEENDQWGMMTIRNYFLDSQGKKRHEKLFNNWATSLKVFDMFQGKASINDISKAIGKYREDDSANTNHYVTNFHNEAKRLIASAENGTFPH